MASTVEFLSDYGVDIRTNGQRRWPDEITASLANIGVATARRRAVAS